MRAAAEVDEFALTVKAQRRFVSQTIFDVLSLEYLAQFRAKFERFFTRLVDLLERLVFLDDLSHFGLDLGKIGIADRMFQVEVVVEPVADSRAKGQFHPVEEPHHSPSHNMRTGVTHCGQRFRITFGNQADRDFAVFRQ